LLDEVYYDFIIAGRKEVDGLARIGEEQSIPLKAVAWLDLSARREGGEPVDAKSIRKHAYDVLRLSQVLTADSKIEIAAKISEDMRSFLDRTASDGTYDPKTIGIDATLGALIERIGQAYRV
jgi:hypothetical protein